MMNETILELARAVAGAGADEALLSALCGLAAERWRLRLRPGVTEEDCGGAFCCAAAYTAAADLAVSRGGDGLESFTAGEVSVRLGTAARGAAGLALRQAAERLMAPYVEPEDFSFRSVRG
nr:hypothetical protein [uncultured Oscillibacter sp.]